MTKQENPFLTAALEYAAMGWSVFPLSPGSKVPLKGSGGSKDASQDAEQIAAWWTKTPNANVAVATGHRSALYVVDVDSVSGAAIQEHLPETFEVLTYAKGQHLYYMIDEDDRLPSTTKGNSNSIDPDCDTRGEGGYVVAPPSIVVEVKDGKRVKGEYRWTRQDAIATLPDIVREKVRPKVELVRVGASDFARRSSAYGRAALRKECDEVAGTGEGGRNHRLHRAACRMGQLVADGCVIHGEAESDLLHAAGACGLKQAEARRTIKSGMDWGCANPRAQSLPVADSWGAMIPAGGFTLDGDPQALDGQIVESRPTPPQAQAARQEEAQAVLADLEAEADRAKKARLQRQRAEDGHRQDIARCVRELGGLCDSYVSWVLRGADYPQPMLAVGSLLALGGIVSSRRLTASGLVSSIYVCHLGDSGTGKDRPRAALATVLDECWPGTLGGASFSSNVSLVDSIKNATHAGHGLGLVLDEYGMQLRGMIGAKASPHRQDIKQTLTEIATNGAKKWSASLSLARGGGKLVLHAPVVVMLASTTPTSLHDILSGVDVADGFVPRHLWLQSQEHLPVHVPYEMRKGEDHVPDEVRAAVAVLQARHEAWSLGLVEAEEGGESVRLYDPQEMEFHPDASSLIARIRGRVDTARRTGATGGIPAGVMARIVEHSARIGMVLAVLSQPHVEVPMVLEDHVEAGNLIAEESARCLAESIAAHSRPRWDDQAAQLDVVIASIRRLGGACSRSDLLRSCRSLSARQVDELLERLQETGEVSASKAVGAKGRHPIVLSLR